MAAARYWRVIGIDVDGGADLELSALWLYDSSVRVDGSATLSCSHAPISGALTALQDADAGTSCRFSGAVVKSGGFWLRWDFGVGVTPSVVLPRPGAASEARNFAVGMTLQFFDGSRWSSQDTFARIPWPGGGQMAAFDSLGGEPYFSDVWALLRMDGASGASASAVADASSTPKNFTAYGSPVYSSAARHSEGTSVRFDGASYLESVESFSAPGEFSVELWANYASFANYGALFSIGDSKVAGGLELQANTLTSPAGLLIYANGSLVLSTSAGILNAGTGYAVQVSRDASGVLRIFVGGVVRASLSITTAFSGRVVIGAERYGSVDNKAYAYIDEVRITGGRSRNTSDYVPTAAAFPGGSGASLVLEAASGRGSTSRALIAAAQSVPAHSIERMRASIARDIEHGGPGTIYGTTKTKGTPNQPTHARVVLLHQRSKLPVRETWSDPVTGNFAFTGIDTTQQFLTLAEDAAGNFRPVAANRLAPEVLP